MSRRPDPRSDTVPAGPLALGLTSRLRAPRHAGLSARGAPAERDGLRSDRASTRARRAAADDVLRGRGAIVGATGRRNEEETR